ncbi:MAG: hypothetical protein QXU20_03825 [Candidatus Woesearchaeota archaeon]
MKKLIVFFGICILLVFFSVFLHELGHYISMKILYNKNCNLKITSNFDLSGIYITANINEQCYRNKVAAFIVSYSGFWFQTVISSLLIMIASIILLSKNKNNYLFIIFTLSVCLLVFSAIYMNPFIQMKGDMLEIIKLLRE